MALVLMQILSITILLTDIGNCRLILRYINRPKTWTKALDHCKSLHGTLFSPKMDELNSLYRCDDNNNISYPIWTGRFKSLSAWIEILDCFPKENIRFIRTVTYNDENITEYDCQQYCSGDISFAQGLSGECVCNVTTIQTDSYPTCTSEHPYRVYRVSYKYNTTDTLHRDDCTARTCCIYTTCNAQCTDITFRRFIATDCCTRRKVKCKNSAFQNEPLSWFDAKSFCNQKGSVLSDKDTLTSDVKDSWIGISRGYAYINSENVQNPDPIKCVMYHKTSLEIAICNIERTFVCKIDIDKETEIKSDDCNVTSTETTSQRTSTESHMSSTEYSTTVTTDYKSTSTSSLSEIQTAAALCSTEIQTTSASYSTENQTTSTSYLTANQTTTSASSSAANLTTPASSSTENQTTSTSYSTKNQTTTSASSSAANLTTPASSSTENQTTSTSYSTKNQTTPASYSTENQTTSTSYSPENDIVTTFTKPSNENKQSEQLPTVVVGSAIGVAVIIIIVVAVLVVVRRKKFLSNKYRKPEKAEETENPAVNETKRSPLPVGSSNVRKSKVYCDPWQSFEESQTMTNAGKKLNRQSQNPMYELTSFQYDSYSVAGGLIKQSHTETYENVNPDIYNHCNLGSATMAASQQNVYDSAAGIYSHLNHGGIKDHNEDTYDHFHGSDQDYDQFDRTIRKTEDTSEYSLYQ